MDETFLVYIYGEGFKSKLVHDLDEAFETAARFIFGEAISAKEILDDLSQFKEDFENQNNWKEGGKLWEIPFSENGGIVIVKIENLLN